MKTLIALAVAVFCALSLSSLAQDTTWHDVPSNGVARSKWSTYDVRTRSDSGWRETTYDISGVIVHTGLYSDDSCHIAQYDHYYYKDGKLHEKITYKDDKRMGNETYYYEDGKVLAEGNNTLGKHEGEWKAWYPSGQPAGTAKFAHGKQVSARFYDEKGNPNDKVDSFFKDSEYPGGPPAFLSFLNKHLKYPNSAVKNNIQGTVILQFKVTKEGKTTDLMIVKSAEASLDKEAYRVLSGMGRWEPASLAGIPMESYKKQPIIFKFSR